MGTNKQVTSNPTSPAERYVFASTYSLVTANRLLSKLGIDVAQKTLAHHLLVPVSFYHQLLHVPAKRLTVSMENDRCRDIQAYAQQKLIHYLFSGEASKPESAPGQAAREHIEQDRLQLVAMGKELTTWEQGSQARTQAVYEALTEKAAAWQRTLDTVITGIMQQLSHHQISTPAHFIKSAYTLVTDFGSTIELSEELRNQLKLPETVGITEKVIIHLLAPIKPLPLTPTLMSVMRPTLLELDKVLLAALDDISGFNQQGATEAKDDLKAIATLSAEFEQHAVKVSRQLFEYYQEHASDKQYKVAPEEALEFGVDEAVADDYKALHYG